jgi:c-di-GMP-binding flagellar brake protein YcgR
MSQDTRPADLDNAGSAGLAHFRVESSHEIAALLRQLRDTSVPVVLSTPGGSAMVSTLWSVDVAQQRVTFSADEADPQLKCVAESDEAVCVGYLDSVKLQFDLNDLLLVRGPSSCALQSSSPSAVYRFQRRSAYRVRTLERHSPTARFRHPSIPDMQLALRVMDVSIGGCALFVPDDIPNLEPGLVLQGVRVELDADTRFTASLQIQHMSSINHQATGLRAGCEWRNLDSDAHRSLQRCIDQTQKRRRLLSLD